MATTSLLIADAGSTDRTVEVAQSFRPRLSIRIIPGGLPSVGRNAGARLATSRYLLFLDADIELADPTLIRRAVELMKRKSLHCLTTDIFCRDGKFSDRFLYRANNFAQRMSRFHRPYSTGMFMLVDRAAFEALGGFDERALFAEDYQLTRQFARQRFRTVRGGIYSTNRRFEKTGRFKMMRMFLNAYLHSGNQNFFRRDAHRSYWKSY
jgi:glycosyltransferase involved in cell wall biosynthesis